MRFSIDADPDVRISPTRGDQVARWDPTADVELAGLGFCFDYDAFDLASAAGAMEADLRA